MRTGTDDGMPNQGRRSHAALWDGSIKYASKAEWLFAKELERLGIPFAPLPMLVVGKVRREVDFVLLHRGRPLVVEIHGRSYHPPLRMVDEWNRTLPWQLAGVRQAFVAATDVMAAPEAAVAGVLALLEAQVA
jgi:hypothetical protein